MAQGVSQPRDTIGRVIKDPVFIKQMIWVALFGVVMVVIILINVDYLKTNYPNPPQPPDRILDLIPQNPDFMYLGETFSRIQICYMVFFFATSADRFRRLPRLFFLLAVMYILRAFALTLTPLAQITPPDEYFAESNFIAQKFYHGMFFSGHSASALIQAFFFWNDRFRGVRITWYILPLACAQIVAMLAGHQHYSIDIFGAVFVAYFVLTFDFARLVPQSLRDVSWMPWYTHQRATIQKGNPIESE